MNKYYLQQSARLLGPALYYSGVHWLTKPFYGGLGHILMFHRVLPARAGLRIHNHESLEVSPAQLEATVQFFKKRGYAMLSLDEAMEWKARDRRFVVFTFDDGYVDNLEHALPVLKKHGVPFTIYVTTGLPEGHAFLWWYLLEDLIVQNNRLELEFPDGRRVFGTDSMKAKELVFNEVRAHLAVADKRQLEFFKTRMFAPFAEANEALTKKISLTWQQVKELSTEPLVSIGSHTVNHYPLHSLSRDESRWEMAESKRILEEKIGKPVKHFCYPIGSYGAKEIELAGELGYASATTVKMHNIFNEHRQHVFALPRIMVNALTTEKILTLQVNGLLPAVRSRGRRVVF